MGERVMVHISSLHWEMTYDGQETTPLIPRANDLGLFDTDHHWFGTNKGERTGQLNYWADSNGIIGMREVHDRYTTYGESSS
jgi:hypothetical protein